MSQDVELGEAGGRAYGSAGSGRRLVLLRPGRGLDGSVFFAYWAVIARRLAETAP